ncbi:MAG: hypothetical protein WDO17_13315 [Alphaproteobacteria bacterium]
MENESPQNPACALARAKWDHKAETVKSSGKRIVELDRASIPISNLPLSSDFKREDFKGFSLDLDNDGENELIFTYDNFKQANAEVEKTGKATRYVVAGGVIRGGLKGQHPDFFHFDHGQYEGGTDAIHDARLVGVVADSPREPRDCRGRSGC